MANTVKVTPDVYKDIKSLHEEGNTAASIANYFKISETSVKKVVNSKNRTEYLNKGVSNVKRAKSKQVSHVSVKDFKELLNLTMQLQGEIAQLKGKVTALDSRLYYLEQENAKDIVRRSNKRWFNFGKES